MGNCKWSGRSCKLHPITDACRPPISPRQIQDVTGSANEDRLFLIWLLTPYNPLTGAVQTYGKPMAGLVAGSITCLMLGISWVEGDQAVDSSDEKAYSGLYILVYHITLWFIIVYYII